MKQYILDYAKELFEGNLHKMGLEDYIAERMLEDCDGEWHHDELPDKVEEAIADYLYSLENEK